MPAIIFVVMATVTASISYQASKYKSHNCIHKRHVIKSVKKMKC
jgi:hypothetical protein